MTIPGEGHETVECPGCGTWVGGDEPVCPFCGEVLWGVGEDDLDDDPEEDFDS
jgi:hypothetical protein